VPSTSNLPGHSLIERGLDDVRAGIRSTESLLVTSAAARLRALGVWESDLREIDPEPEVALYLHLGRTGVSDPYSRYNALRRELASFVRGLEHRIESERRAAEATSR
jgi:hypothetical protein